MAKIGYDLGAGPPARCSVPGNAKRPCTAGNSATEPYIVSHHLLLAHGTAVKLYREKYLVRQSVTYFNHNLLH